MTWPVRVIVVSSVTPKPTGFGEITLYRHLAEEPKLAVEVVSPPGVPKAVRLLRRTSFRGFEQCFESLRQGRRWDARARALAESLKPQVIFTEAAGDGYQAATRLARQTGIPLLARFSDWWPDLVPGWVRAREEARFRELYQTSKIALCVSRGMKQALGEHPDSRLLWPIPGKMEVGGASESIGKTQRDGTFRILYSGNLREYGPMLRAALLEMKDHPLIRLEARGMSPHWPAALRNEMRRLGLYHEFAPREELERWLGSADAFLVTSAFEPSMRRLMETNFPSKLLEFARFGKPLVVWGPDYSTLVRWAEPGRRALCISESDPKTLRLAIEKLAASRGERQRLADEASAAMRREFDPAVIQDEFLQAVCDVASWDKARARAEIPRSANGSGWDRTAAEKNQNRSSRKTTFLGAQFRYLFRSFPTRTKLWHRVYFFYEIVRLVGRYLAFRLALSRPGPTIKDAGKTCVVVLLSHNRPQNLEILVRGALKNNFVQKVIVSNSNPAFRIADWVKSRDSRLVILDSEQKAPAGRRFLLAAREQGKYFLTVDDDIFFTPRQWARLFECLLAKEEVPHGISGQLYQPGILFSNGTPFHHRENTEEEVDVLIGAYAFTRAHLERMFRLTDAVRLGCLSMVANGEDILLSFSGAFRPRIHHLGHPLLCASTSLRGIAVWNTRENFWDERVKLFEKVRRARIDIEGSSPVMRATPARVQSPPCR